MSRQEKLQMLLRQNEGRSKRPSFVNRMADLTGSILLHSDFLSLEETDKLREKITTLWRNAGKHKFASVHEAQEFIRHLNIPEKMTGVMLLSISEYLGGMKVVIPEMVSKIEEIFRIESDTINFYSVSGSFFLGIDFFEDFGEWKYEVSYIVN